MRKPPRASSPSLYSLLLIPILSCSTLAALSDLKASYGLTSGTYNFPFPPSTLNSGDTDNWVNQNWWLTGRISFGSSDM
jgi:hypothetical protein